MSNFGKDTKTCPFCNGKVSGHLCGETVIYWCDTCGANNTENPPTVSMEFTEPTPPDQSEDWIDQILGTFAEDLIAYDKRMTDAGAPPIRFVHKYLKKAKTAIRKHERQAAMEGWRKGWAQRGQEEDYSMLIGKLRALKSHPDAFYLIGEIEHAAKECRAELQQPTQPPAADTTKQGEGESDE